MSLVRAVSFHPTMIMTKMTVGRARSECTDEAHDQVDRRVEIESVHGQGRGDWDVSLQTRDRTGRDTRLRCDDDARTRLARVTRIDP